MYYGSTRRYVISLEDENKCALDTWNFIGPRLQNKGIEGSETHFPTPKDV